MNTRAYCIYNNGLPTFIILDNNINESEIESSFFKYQFDNYNSEKIKLNYNCKCGSCHDRKEDIRIFVDDQRLGYNQDPFIFKRAESANNMIVFVVDSLYSEYRETKLNRLIDYFISDDRKPSITIEKIYYNK